MLGDVIEIYIIVVAYYCFHILTIHFLLFSGNRSDVFFVLLFWQKPWHLGRHLLYGLVTIYPALPYRISSRITSTFYRTKAYFLAAFRYDPVAARTMGVIGQDRATISIFIFGFAILHIAVMRYTCFRIIVLNTLSLFLYLFRL